MKCACVFVKSLLCDFTDPLFVSLKLPAQTANFCFMLQFRSASSVHYCIADAGSRQAVRVLTPWSESFLFPSRSIHPKRTKPNSEPTSGNAPHGARSTKPNPPNIPKTMFHPRAVDPDFDQSGYGLIAIEPSIQNSARERSLFVYVLIQALMDIGMIQPFAQGRKQSTYSIGSPSTLKENSCATTRCS